jgi:hypothetical protein
MDRDMTKLAAKSKICIVGGRGSEKQRIPNRASSTKTTTWSVARPGRRKRNRADWARNTSLEGLSTVFDIAPSRLASMLSSPIAWTQHIAVARQTIVCSFLFLTFSRPFFPPPPLLLLTFASTTFTSSSFFSPLLTHTCHRADGRSNEQRQLGQGART